MRNDVCDAALKTVLSYLFQTRRIHSRNIEKWHWIVEKMRLNFCVTKTHQFHETTLNSSHIHRLIISWLVFIFQIIPRANVEQMHNPTESKGCHEQANDFIFRVGLTEGSDSSCAEGSTLGCLDFFRDGFSDDSEGAEEGAPVVSSLATISPGNGIPTGGTIVKDRVGAEVGAIVGGLVNKEALVTGSSVHQLVSLVSRPRHPGTVAFLVLFRWHTSSPIHSASLSQ